MLKKAILSSIKIYQSLISPVLGKNCRFYPSCSEYAALAIEKYGAIRGAWKALKRVVRCNQWQPGGVEMP
ncbi:MAG: membrane protein insertion efficiency factor YidD [Candidatus Nealsonbacteria bacterium]|nr:membrane protein insertion efficiency factor YidD [Candidatus Nealsonbacteria bacterium]